MWHDLKFAGRQLLRHPVSNLIIVLTVALLLGAVSTLYASYLATARERNPFPQPKELVRFWRTAPDHTAVQHPYSIYEGLRTDLESFDYLGAMGNLQSKTLHGYGEPVSYTCRKVTADILQMTEIPPHLGRLFTEVDENPGSPNIVILSHKVWMEKFESDPDVIGRILKLDEDEYEVVGVLDARLDDTVLGVNRLWLPLNRPSDRYIQTRSFSLYGRLNENVAHSQASSELQTLAGRLEAEHAPSNAERQRAHTYDSARIVPITKNLMSQSEETRRKQRGALIFGVAILVSVILIACFNVTNLLLVRATSRTREIAIRLSIGASRQRIIRQLLTESVLLASVGAVLGFSVAQLLWASFRVQSITLKFDLQVFGVAALGAIVLGALVGILPAWQASRSGFTAGLKDGSHSSAGKRRHRLRNTLVAGQVALATVLCVGSVLMTRNFINIKQKELGFEPEGMMTLSARMDSRYRDQAKSLAFADQGLQRLREHPAVAEAAASYSGGLTFFSLSEQVRLDESAGLGDEVVDSGCWYTTPNMLDMYGVSVVRGRGLNEQENSEQAEILINQLFVDRYLPNIDPIGLSLHIRTLDRWMTVVGVVRNRSPLTSFHETQPEFYASYRHATYVGEVTFHVRTRSSVKASARSIRPLLTDLDPAQPISQAKFLPDLIAQRLAGAKAAMLFLSLFAGFGIFIALLGIYGVVSYTVAERTREVGIRMALGAAGWNILRLLAAQAFRLLSFGCVVGLILAFAVTQGVPEELLYELSPRDPISYLSVLFLIAIVGATASLLPASKATRLKPMDALRYE